MRRAMCPTGVMVLGMRLGWVVKASSRALSTAAGRPQRRALVAATDTADQDQVTRKSFTDVQREREEQARHSVLIDCPAKINEKTFLKHLSRHGEIASHFFFGDSDIHALVEFVNKESIDSLLAATRLPEDRDTYVVPFKSRFIKIKSKELSQEPVSCTQEPSLSFTQLLQELCAANSIADQAQIILEKQQLTEESIRLRYLVSSLVRDIATAYFPEATVHLYGSSVNSFGKMGCDVDLFLDLDSIKNVSRRAAGPFVTEYWMRRVSSSRVVQQKILSIIGDCIDSFGPGCTKVQKILNARCPLVGFFHQATGFNCDLTADNSLDQLKDLAGKNDTCIIEGNDCTFVSDLSKIKPSANTEPLDKLLAEFLEFYGTFDFSQNCIDIYKGVAKNKPDSSPLYIQNPFEQSLNISKNVNKSQLERFVHLVQESSWKLQKQGNQSSESRNRNWGLSSILIEDNSKKLPSERLGSIIDSIKSNSKRTTQKKTLEC
ncbi:poly(A) RNA polymerase, mitochondrial [Mantella aurantiaca]